MSRAAGYPVIVVPSLDYFARLHYRLRARLPMWVIYTPHTREYPGVFVARMHVILPQPRPSRFTITHDTLVGLRARLPPGLARLPRDPADVPEIVELWL